MSAKLWRASVSWLRASLSGRVRPWLDRAHVTSRPAVFAVWSAAVLLVVSRARGSMAGVRARLSANAARLLVVFSAATVGAAASVVGSCGSEAKAPRLAGEPARSASPSRRVRVPDLRPGGGASTGPRARDALWREALRRDRVDLERLANREGAVGLLDAIEEGGDVGLTALAALPYADDADVALSRLCAILAARDQVARAAVLRAVHDVVARPQRPREPVAPDGVRHCAPVLAELASDGSIPLAERDLAGSATTFAREYSAR